MDRTDINTLDFNKLSELLAQPLPGQTAHRQMIPPGRKLMLSTDEFSRARQSVVLILLFKEDQILKVCLTQRSSTLRDHAGQISFPGGRVEPGDRDLFQAALREAQEEIGIRIEEVRLAGELSELHIPVSGFVVQPFVGWTDQAPSFTINQEEVESLLILPFEEILDKEKLIDSMVETSLGPAVVPSFRSGPFIIWGATAMMLAELAMMLCRCFRPGRGGYWCNV